MPVIPVPSFLKKRFPAILALAITAVFFGLGLSRIDWDSADFLTSLDLRWLDGKFRLRGPQSPGNDVILVGIDEKTVSQLGSARTWRRTNYASLIDQIAKGQPKVIGFDAFFSEPDTSGADNDRLFAGSIEKAGNVVLGVTLELESTTGERRQAQALDPEFQNLVIEKQIFPAERRPSGATRQVSSMIQGKDLVLNLPILSQAGASFGFVNFHPDSEGRLRYQPQFIEYGGKLYPSLDLQLLRRYFDAPSIVVDFQEDRIAGVQVGDLSIPTDEYGRFLLNFNGPTGTHQTVSMVDVMEGRVGGELFRDKIVVIGPTALGLKDVVATPFDPVLPGVELHANVIDNVLHQRFLVRDALTKLIDLALILVFGVLVAVYLPRMNATRSLFYSSLVFVAFTVLNIWTFTRLNLVLSFVYPGLALLASSGSLIGYKYLTEEREKKRTKAVFQYYLDQHVVEQVMNSPEKLQLGGERRELTVLFSDIRGFTSFSEMMAPSELVSFLNHYFDLQTKLIFHYKGTLDKLIGDCIMCFWGHPLDLPDHPLRGAITALEMVHALDDMRKDLQLPGGAKFDIGVGLNTGFMAVGNMGSQNRFSYTVMGDNVNLASRLEGLTKYYGIRIIISDSTYEQVKNQIFCRELDTIQVKGKSQAVTIYEPLGMRRSEYQRRQEDRRGEMTFKKRLIATYVQSRHGERRKEDRRLGTPGLIVKPQQEEIAAIYGHGLELYRQGNFDEAEKAFEHVLSLSPGDGPSKLMTGRIAKYRAEYAATGAQFDPVYKFEEK